MRIHSFCFLTSALAALTGMSLGIYMGINKDFALAPAHAHLNLLGWVTMALYGLYHRGRDRSAGPLAWAQVGCGAAGFPLMAGGLGVMLTTGSHGTADAIMAGAVLSWLGMVLFLAVLVSDMALVAIADDDGERGYGW
jgi:hypothetical protein